MFQKKGSQTLPSKTVVKILEKINFQQTQGNGTVAMSLQGKDLT